MRRGIDRPDAPDAVGISTLDEVVTRLRADPGAAADRALGARVASVFAKDEARVRRFIERKLPGLSPQQVEDTVQDVLVVAWRKLPELQGGDFSAWLFQIARNECANVRRKRRELLPGHDALTEPASPEPSPYRALRRKEQAQLVRDVDRGALTPEERTVLQMSEELGLPRTEIAKRANLAGANEVRVVLQKNLRKRSRELERRLAELNEGPSFLSGDSHER